MERLRRPRPGDLSGDAGLSLKILYVGSLGGTSLHRARALERLGHQVRAIESGPPRSGIRRQLHSLGHRLRRPPDLFAAGRAMLRALAAERFDVLWVDKGLCLGPRALARARARAAGAVLVNYSPDDMTSRRWNSAQYLRALSLYDLHVTTKSYAVPELGSMGARRVLFVDKGFDPETHRPLDLTPEERRRFGADVGFVGFFEKDRAEAMEWLARAGVVVAIHGPGWQSLRARERGLDVRGAYLEGADYVRAINATRINLGFLRKAARDRQTNRSIEIPACGGFLLAERTDEHLRLFREGVEAEFFGSHQEMLEKCRWYLQHEEARARIAAAARRRCLEGGYRNEDRMQTVIEGVEAVRREIASSRR